MPKTVEYILGVYRMALWLYPTDLRHSYGADMAAAFEELLRTESARSGSRGLARIGCRAIGELFTVAIPLRIASEELMTAGLTLAINSGVLALLVWFLMRSPPPIFRNH